MRKDILSLLLVISLFSVSVFASSEYIVTSEKINVRTDSTVSADSLGFLDKGDRVEVLEEKFNWAKIKLPEKISCYASNQHIKKISSNKGEVTASKLNLRSKPSLDAYVLGKAHLGDTLNIIKKIDDWYEIAGYPYAKGWVHMKFLYPVQEGTADLSSQIKSIVPHLSEPNMREKAKFHQELIAKGEEIIPILETYLPNADRNTSYSIINVLTQLGRSNPELISYLINKVDDSSIKVASIYLDIAQNIIQPENKKVGYFYLSENGKLSLVDIEKAKQALKKDYLMSTAQ